MVKVDSDHWALLWKSAARGNLVNFKEKCEFILKNVDKDNYEFFITEIISAVKELRERFAENENAQKTLSEIDAQCDIVLERLDKERYDSINSAK